MHRLLFLAAFLGVSASAQDAPALALDAPRVLHDATTELKGPDGTPTVYRFTTPFAPATGEYLRTVRDASGSVVREKALTATLVAPTLEEDAYARAAIEADPEIAALIAEAEYPVKVTGGFVLSREEGHACGPRTRCLQYDVLETLPDRKTARRVRYVVIDLRTGEIVSRNFDPDAEGNLANPAFRVDSRLTDAAE